VVQQGCGVEAIVYVAELRDDASNTIKGPAAVTVIERIRRVVTDEFQVSVNDMCQRNESAKRDIFALHDSLTHIVFYQME
jgi:hypothetical protein